jgi:hypothetical protein
VGCLTGVCTISCTVEKWMRKFVFLCATGQWDSFFARLNPSNPVGERVDSGVSGETGGVQALQGSLLR